MNSDLNADIRIRDALPEDISSIQVLMSTYFLDIEGVLVEDFVVAQSGEKIVGAGAIVNGRFPEVHSIAVHPNYRGKGIGSSVIRYLLLRLKSRNDTGICVYTRTTSPLFFEKVGFIELDPVTKAELWEDCSSCDRLSTCRQSVMCLKQGQR
ncbi:amino-acid acetyltransferase [Methanolobus psychrophilus R15]|nr:amino-acid acetyltransferase [Methanolobus psychrophilus R15]